MTAGRARPRAALAALALGGLLGVAGTAAAQAPQPPRERVDTAPVAPTGRTIAVRAGGDLQAAIDAARFGDVITLEAGATFTGPFTLPRKAGSGWIVIRTSEPDGRFPAPGTRVGPAHARLMPKLVSPTSPVIAAAPGAHHYRLVGLEVHPPAGVFLYNLITFGEEVRTPDEVPHHLVVDRCLLRGDPDRGSRRGVALNARHAAVVDSHLAGFREPGADSQAVAGWSGPGPFKIANSYLEAAGENVMFGGADPLIPDLVPSDIEIRGNHLAKPPAWQAQPRDAEGRAWTVKNLFELKNARRVAIEGNLFEHNWAQSQTGFAILFTVRNQDGGAPWSVIEDVLFAGNVVRRVGAGVSVLGSDDSRPSAQARRIAIRNNLFEQVGAPPWAGRGTLFQVLNGPAHLVIEHNTALQTGDILVVEGPPPEGFVFRRNITAHGPYGIIGTDTGPGGPTIDRYFRSAVIAGNVIAGAKGARYPRGNQLPSSLDDVGFVDRGRGDYRLAPDSRYRGTADGRDPGADLDALRPAFGAARGAPGAG